MKWTVVAVAIAVASTPLTQRLLRETNAHAATRRGVAAFERGDFDRAANDLGEAERLRPGQLSSFNRGTAEVAAGRLESGVGALTAATHALALRERALYNRGSAMLAAHQTDRAIADLEETLRLNPANIRAKRNLEIALRKKSEESAGSGEGSKSPQPRSGAQQQQQQAPSQTQSASQKPTGGEPNLEAILESVAQQEREEMRRMRRRARGERGSASW